MKRMLRKVTANIGVELEGGWTIVQSDEAHNFYYSLCIADMIK
jgi:hypothetical protein